MGVPIPIRGPLAVPFRIFGITQSKMNPNICTICERAFRRVQKQQHVTAIVTILFADIRGYTRLSERMDPVEMSEIVNFKANALKPSGRRMASLTSKWAMA
jgi:adenylate cyclase